MIFQVSNNFHKKKIQKEITIKKKLQTKKKHKNPKKTLRQKKNETFFFSYEQKKTKTK